MKLQGKELKEWKEQQVEVMLSAFDSFVDIIVNMEGYYYLNRQRLVNHLKEHLRSMESVECND